MNYLVSKMIFHGLHLSVKTKKSRGEKKYIISLLNKVFRSIASFKIYMPFFTTSKHVFYVGTNNQNSVLNKIYNRISGNKFVYYHGNDVDICSSDSKKFPFWIAFCISFFSYFFSFKLRSSVKRKLFTVNPNLNFDYEICLLLGFYYLNLLILKISQPKYVWLSNDHTNINVSFIYAAKMLRIKTIYIQHASVSEIFPSLNFDIAFLDGTIAHSIYRKIGIAGTKVFLTGNPKLDGCINKNSNRIDVKKILVCLNSTDDPRKFEGIINQILNMNIKVKLRKHPYLNLNLKNEHLTEVSKEKEFMDCLEDVDLVIAGDSNVHLEATASNIPSMYISSSVFYDYYGFVFNNLVIWSGYNESDLIIEIKKYNPYFNVYKRAKPYFESIDTDFQNRSTEKILSLVENDYTNMKN